MSAHDPTVPALVITAGGVAVIVLVLVAAWVKDAGGLIRIVVRFAVGLPLDGKRRTDAGLLRRGTRPMTAVGYASRWAHMSYARTAGVRWLVVAGLAALGWGWHANRPVCLAAAATLAGLATLAGAWWSVRAFRRWQHMRTYVRPLHQALAPLVGTPLADPPESWLTVPRGFTQKDDARIEVLLPPRWVPEKGVARLVEQTVLAKLALEDAHVQTVMVGRPRMIVTTSPPPPKSVPAAVAVPLFDAAEDTAPVLGQGRRSVTVTADLALDSPHVLVSAGSGGGKSVLTRTLVAQGLHRGGVAVVLDVKRISHTWLRGMGSVRYARSAEELHAACLALQAECNRRNALVDEFADQDGNFDHVDVGPRVWVIAEEMNAAIARLQAYWKETKQKGDPAQSPAVGALQDVLFMGRAVRMHVVGIAQMMTARALGGPEARENFALRCLTRYTMNAWKMLVPEVWPMPSASRHPGRWQVVTGGHARETQVAFLTPAEARDYATNGTVGQLPDLLADSAAGVVTSTAVEVDRGPVEVEDQAAALDQLPAPVEVEPAAAVAGSQPAARAAEQGAGGPGVTDRPPLRLVGQRTAQRPVSLSEAVRTGVVTCSKDAVRQARQRDPEFPREVDRKGSTLLYDPAALARWERNRPGTPATRKARPAPAGDQAETSGEVTA